MTALRFQTRGGHQTSRLNIDEKNAPHSRFYIFLFPVLNDFFLSPFSPAPVKAGSPLSAALSNMLQHCFHKTCNFTGRSEQTKLVHPENSS